MHVVVQCNVQLCSLKHTVCFFSPSIRFTHDSMVKKLVKNFVLTEFFRSWEMYKEVIVPLRHLRTY
jgi:hypothetical protein